MRYRVFGQDEASGEHIELVVEAESIGEAEGKAQARGVRAERVERADETHDTADHTDEPDDRAPLRRPGRTPGAPKAPEEALWTGGPSQWVNCKAYLGALVVGAALVALAWVGPKAMSMDAPPWWVYPACLAPSLLVVLVVSIKTAAIRYELTTERIRERRGIFTRTLEEIELFRVDDSEVRQTLWQRVAGLGTVTLHASDATSPKFVLRSIRRHEDLRNAIRREVERRRRERPYETIGGVGGEF